MDGDKALTYMRSRKEDGAGGDEGRQLRQQQVITALYPWNVNVALLVISTPFNSSTTVLTPSILIAI
jgi:hypothetical protein